MANFFRCRGNILFFEVLLGFLVPRFWIFAASAENKGAEAKPEFRNIIFKEDLSITQANFKALILFGNRRESVMASL